MIKTVIPPQIGQKFKVTFDKFNDHFIGQVTEINEDGEYVIALTKRTKYDIVGHPYTLPDCFITVELLWFDTELTGRKITLI